MGKREAPSPRRQRRRRRRSWPRTLLLVVVVAAALYAGVHCLFQAPKLAEADAAEEETLSDTKLEDAQSAALAAHKERKPYFYTILLSGEDDGNGGSDTNILIGFDGQNGAIYGASIPRDTKAIINGKKHKINFAYNSGGSELLADTVSEQLGIPVDFTVSVDLKGFEALVDAIGGVDFEVPVDMDYDDPYQDLHIHFSKGMQHLNGQEAMEVCRFRKNADGTGYPMGDVQRSETVRNLMITVAKKVVGNLGKLDQFVDIMERNIETDLSGKDLAWFVTKAVGVNLDTGVQGNSLPGDGNVSCKGYDYCYELEPAESLALINQLVNPFTTSLTAEDVNFAHLNESNGRLVRADASLFQTEEAEDQTTSSSNGLEYD